MRLATELLHQITNPQLSLSERAVLRCQLARQCEEAGDYEAAEEAMGELWQGVGKRPILEALDEQTQAHVLLRLGALTGWIGGTKQIEGAQELAKDLINESIRLFEALGETERAAAAQTDLAYCYWREGGFDNARVILQEALIRLADVEDDTKALALLRSALVEKCARRFHDALRIHAEAAPLFEKSTNQLLKGNFHNEFANVLNYLHAAEQSEDHVDRALIEYSAASFHFEQAGHARYQGCVENNLGFLLGTIGRFAEAHEHLDRAQMIYTRLKDDHVAQIDDTRARVLLAEGRSIEAEKTARGAVRILEKGDELSLLAEALTTHGIALARLHHADQALEALERAVNVAEQAGDFESAGLAALTLIEQLGANLSNEEVWATIERAGVLLDDTHDMATLRRLAKAAFRALRAIPAPPDWTNFSLQRTVLRYEGHWIKLALKETGGKVTPAARLLGLKHHQTLIHLIKARHTELLNTRLAVRKRRRHIFSKSRKIKKKKGPDLQTAASQIRILHVEDNKAVANLVKETLGLEGWNIEICSDGNLALQKLSGHTHYDLILLDNDLPGMNGLQLAKQTRAMAHRRQTPIVMLSATVDDAMAQSAGAEVALRKPEDISSLADTVRRLVNFEKTAEHSSQSAG
jgi:two-component system chemotaxis response regulator CheY